MARKDNGGSKTPRPEIREQLTYKQENEPLYSGRLLRLGGGDGVQYIATYSELLLIEWSSHDEGWTRFTEDGRYIVVPNSGKLSFRKDTLLYMQLLVWPCSLSGYSEVDSGWAIDKWFYTLESDAVGSDFVHVDIHIGVAIRGIGSRLNRIGYGWTAYLKEQTGG